jgi:hypothetical protein
MIVSNHEVGWWVAGLTGYPTLSGEEDLIYLTDPVQQVEAHDAWIILTSKDMPLTVELLARHHVILIVIPNQLISEKFQSSQIFKQVYSSTPNGQIVIYEVTGI